MKFQFCGNISCPEWFLAEIAVLTKITALKIKLILSQLILRFLQGIDISAKTCKLLQGTGLDFYQMNAVIGTLDFILNNSITFRIDDSILRKQLIDLGLPKCMKQNSIENVESITKTYKTHRDQLLEHSSEIELKLSSNIHLQYSIHQILVSRYLDHTKHKFAEINLQYKNSQGNNSNLDFVICQMDLDDLINSLEEAVELMGKTQNKINQ